jgi:hypothetical protein
VRAIVINDIVAVPHSIVLRPNGLVRDRWNQITIVLAAHVPSIVAPSIVFPFSAQLAGKIHVAATLPAVDIHTSRIVCVGLQSAVDNGA